MKVLIISDGHGALAQLDKLGDAAKGADLVLFGGDFAQFGKPETGMPFLERLASLHDRVFSVTGNCDEREFRDKLEEYDVGIEGSLSYFSGLVLSGAGGALAHTGATPNERTDEELVSDLALIAESVPEEALADGSPWGNLVLVVHHPPKDTKLDAVGAGLHVGSTLVRKFIETYKPLLVVSGHIHESSAIDKLGPTTLVNPGALAEGRYAVAEITGGKNVPFAVSSIELRTL